MFCFKILNLNDADTFQYRENKYCKDANGSDVFNHYNVEFFALEFCTDIHFLNDDFGLKNVSYKQAGDKCDNGHHYTVGDKVKHFKEVESNGLNGDEGKGAVSQSGKGAKHQTDCQYNEAGGFARPTFFIHKYRNDGFHKGDRGGDGGKEYEKEEECTDNVSTGHLFKYLGKGGKHKTCAFAELGAVSTCKYCGDNHKSCKEGNTKVKNCN